MEFMQAGMSQQAQQQSSAQWAQVNARQKPCMNTLPTRNNLKKSISLCSILLFFYG
jgi:hypothetical protein